MTTLNFNVGDCFELLSFGSAPKTYRHHLLSIGLRVGTHCHIVRRAPFGDPIEVKCGGIHLVLRKHEMARLKFAKVE